LRPHRRDLLRPPPTAGLAAARLRVDAKRRTGRHYRPALALFLFEAGLAAVTRAGAINARGTTICRLCHCGVEACVSNNAYQQQTAKFLHARVTIAKIHGSTAGKVDLHHG